MADDIYQMEEFGGSQQDPKYENLHEDHVVISTYESKMRERTQVIDAMKQVIKGTKRKEEAPNDSDNHNKQRRRQVSGTVPKHLQGMPKRP